MKNLAGRGAEMARQAKSVLKRRKTVPSRAADSVERVYVAVKEFAVDYRFRPGERINEVDLGVSRTPVRSALNRLERDGFVTAVANKGFYARELTPEAVRDLYELRAAIERGAFILACERASEAEIESVAAIWESRSHPSARESWAEVAVVDEQFHLALAALSKNAQMTAALDDLSQRIRFFRRIDLETEQRRTHTYQEHAAIVDALRRRAGKTGAALMEKHITLSSTHAIDVATRGLARIFFRKAA
jgi:DNA-binding GntR family transcriptional regulator